MGALDSRSLGHTDCYMKRFSSSGPVRYQVVRGFGPGQVREESGLIFTIDVAKGRAKVVADQHEVAVREEDGRMTVDRPQLDIGAGDVVIWYAGEPTTPRFSIVGEGDKGRFSSAELTTEAIYTHPFGLPGTYRWVDANGSSLQGEIVVRPVKDQGREARERWLESLRKGPTVTLRGSSAQPNQIEIVVGQTIAWIAERASGVSITDAALLEAGSRPIEDMVVSKPKGRRPGPSRSRKAR